MKKSERFRARKNAMAAGRKALQKKRAAAVVGTIAQIGDGPKAKEKTIRISEDNRFSNLLFALLLRRASRGIKLKA